LDHTLTCCTAPGQAYIWGLARNLWLFAYSGWYKPTASSILECGAISLRSTTGATDTAASRLYRILLSKFAYLIWKLCCERHIKHTNLKVSFETELCNRWSSTIQCRYDLDWAMTNDCFGKKTLDGKVAAQTWNSI
ncbi:uncharacterized protein PHACADRAFT_55287, partial [Phanerochaete carnosa HHB-10118-sp]